MGGFNEYLLSPEFLSDSIQMLIFYMERDGQNIEY